MTALKFRNLDASPDEPVESWPFEGVLAALERGTLPDWRRVARSIGADPWGPVARQVTEALSFSRPYGVAELMEAVIIQARLDAAVRERMEVAGQITALLDRSGVSRTVFAERIGTSASRLSTYLSGKVTPSASLLVRMRGAAERLSAR